MSKLDGKWVGPIFTQETPAGTVNGSNKIFTVTGTPHSDGAFILWLDGVVVKSADYTRVGSQVTMDTAPANGQSLYAFYVKV